MRVCVFQIKGQYGHWRKWFTTTSSLTYSFPPRTAIIGLIGAILGIKRDKIPETFPVDSTHVAICPVKPIDKGRMPQNWRQSPLAIKNGKIDRESLKKMNENFQSNLEIIRYPEYQIVFNHRDKTLLKELVKRLEDKRWVFQPYLGIMGFLADVEFQSEDDVEEKHEKRVEIASILPLNEESEKNIDLSESTNYIREERIPVDVLPGRQFRYLTVGYVETNGQSIILKAKEWPILYNHLKASKRNIIFIESCVR